MSPYSKGMKRALGEPEKSNKPVLIGAAVTVAAVVAATITIIIRRRNK